MKVIELFSYNIVRRIGGIVMQERYWNKMTDKRYRVYYISEYYDRCVRVLRIINIFLAVTSSGAIAAWVIWKEFPVIWAGVIALSQVITAVKPYLPFEKRIEGMNEIINQFSVICNEMEAKWLYVSKGSLTEEEINDLYYDFEKRWADVEATSLKGDSIPINDKIATIANEKKDQYYDNQF
jgi:hypothetical protein